MIQDIPYASPLPVSAPSVLWRQNIASTAGAAGGVYSLALAGERVAMTRGNSLTMLNRATGAVVAHVQPADSVSVEPVTVADPAGNFYFATAAVRSVAPDGSVRWTKTLGPNLDITSNETTTTSNLALSPDGILYFAATDGFFYAVRASDGTEAWRASISVDAVQGGVNGVGDTVWLGTTPYRRADGMAGAPFTVGGRVVAPAFVTSEGVWAAYLDGQWVWQISLLSPCGALLRNTTLDYRQRWYWLSDKRILLADGVAHTASILTSTGGVELGIKPLVPYPVAVAADGVIYARSICQGQGEATTLAAYSQQLEQLWSLDLGGPCTGNESGVAIADDGVLYIPVGSSTGVDVVAVQTASPGMARTAYATESHNVLRTNWLAPP